MTMRNKERQDRLGWTEDILNHLGQQNQDRRKSHDGYNRQKFRIARADFQPPRTACMEAFTSAAETQCSA